MRTLWKSFPIYEKKKRPFSVPVTSGEAEIFSKGDGRGGARVRLAAASILLLMAFFSPWLTGAQISIPGGLWWWSGLLLAPFLLVSIQRMREFQSPPLPGLAIGATALLLLFLAGWAVRPESEFATPFAAENWGWIIRRYPEGVLQPPRLERLCFLFCLLLAFVSAFDLGSSRVFRRRLCWTMGINGILLGTYAVGMRWLDWKALPWLKIGGGMEQFNVAFFHHCGASACFNTGCLILIFHLAARESSRTIAVAKIVFGILIITLGAAALPLWHSESAIVIAAGILGAGLAWFIVAKIALASQSWLRGALAAVFASLFAWQAQQLWDLHQNHPDAWKGAEATLLEATDRDAHVREMANRRDDRLVVSGAPPRPVAWMAAARMAADYPLLGRGPGSWIKLIPLYSNEPIMQTFFQHRQFAHHDLLQIAAEWGILPALLFLFLWIGGLTRATAPAENYLNGNLAIIIGLVTLALHTLLHFPLQIPALQIWAALLLGVAWSTAENQSSAQP